MDTWWSLLLLYGESMQVGQFPETKNNRLKFYEDEHKQLMSNILVPNRMMSAPNTIVIEFYDFISFCTSYPLHHHIEHKHTDIKADSHTSKKIFIYLNIFFIRGQFMAYHLHLIILPWQKNKKETKMKSMDGPDPCGGGYTKNQ